MFEILRKKTLAVGVGGCLKTSNSVDHDYLSQVSRYISPS